MNSWVANNKKLQRPSNVFSGVMTAASVNTNPFKVTAGGACDGLRLDVVISAVTVVGSISLIIQHSSDSTNWETMKTNTISAAGVSTFKFLPNIAGDQTYMPLKHLIRLVATTTNAGDTFTIDNVLLMQEE